jgi:hypothetical protein
MTVPPSGFTRTMSKLGLMGAGAGGGLAWLPALVPPLALAGGGLPVDAAVATVVLAVPGEAAPPVVVP